MLLHVLLRVRRSEPRETRDLCRKLRLLGGQLRRDTSKPETAHRTTSVATAFNPESKDLLRIARQTESRQRRLKWTSADCQCALPCCAALQPSQVLQTTRPALTSLHSINRPSPDECSHRPPSLTERCASHGISMQNLTETLAYQAYPAYH